MKIKALFAAAAAALTMAAVPAMAAETVKVSLPAFDVTLNGVKVDNADSQYPLLVYKDVTYVPMTWNLTQFMGLKTRFGPRPRGENSDNVFFVGNSGTYADSLAPYEAESPNKASGYTALVADYKIFVNETQENQAIDNSAEEYPILNFRDITYFPLTWRFMHDSFGWDYSFDAEKGLVIDSRGAFRPVLDESNIWITSNIGRATTQMNYVHNDDEYVGFRNSTFGDGTLVVWGRRGLGETVVDLADILYNRAQDPNYRAISYWNAEGNPLNDSSVQPRIEGDIFYVRCVAQYSEGVGQPEQYETYDLEIDLSAKELVSVRKVDMGN